MRKDAGHDLDIPIGGVRPGRRRGLRLLGVAVLLIGIDVAVATYRVETRRGDDPRVADVMRSAARAHKRQMGLLYGTTAADLMGMVGKLNEPVGHAVMIGLAAALAAVVCFRVAEVSGPQ